MYDIASKFEGVELNFLKDLTDSEKQLLASGTFIKKFDKGALIHNSGEPCTGIIFVKKGRLRAYMLSEQGREITLYYVEAGENCVLSASCVMSCISFEVFIEAEEDTEAVQISAAVFKQLKDSNIKVENFVLNRAVERFSDVMWAMQQLLFFSMDKRLAMYLYDEVNKTNSLELNVTHEQIAKSLGTAREVVTRLLQQFTKQGLVELSRGKIKVFDKSKLIKVFD